MDIIEYDALIMVTPKDFERLKPLYTRLCKLLPARKIYFVGSPMVGEALKQYQNQNTGLEKIDFLCEEDILPFDKVYTCMKEALYRFNPTIQLSRGACGWYYQQFLKMAYSLKCSDSYYLVWDGDTVPTDSFSMFKADTQIPYLDLKSEYHEEYFITMSNLLPGLKKVIQKSFIAEHMLIRNDIMKELIQKIEGNGKLWGKTFYEKVINAIAPDKLLSNSFSEFETYGTFVALTKPTAYRLREWHSFRYAGEFFEMDKISEEDFKWLSKDFFAISFEKGNFVREDHKNLFDNKIYQQKMSARQMLMVAQKEFGEGSYQEIWDDELEQKNRENQALNEVIVRINSCLEEKKWPEMFEELKKGFELNKKSYELYYLYGYYCFLKNLDQAYLCFEMALFYCDNEADRKVIKDDIDRLVSLGRLKLRKTKIIIVSYNQEYMMKKNIESITNTLPKDSYELVVVDNGSTDGITSYLETLPDITLIKNSYNAGFAAACNQGAKVRGDGENYSFLPDYIRSKGDEEFDILLLNNDTRLSPNALFYLRMGLYEGDDIGATGSLSNYAGNNQQLDVTFELPGDYLKFGEKNNIPMDNPYEERVRLSGFAMLIKAGAWNLVKGLDEDFNPGYFEDDDFSMKLLKAGLKMLVCKNSFIYHAGSQSFAKRNDVEELLLGHHRLFMDKWGFDILKFYDIRRSLKEKISEYIEKNSLDEAKCKVLITNCGLGADLRYLEGIFPKITFYATEDRKEFLPLIAKKQNILKNIEEIDEKFGLTNFDLIF